MTDALVAIAAVLWFVLWACWARIEQRIRDEQIRRLGYRIAELERKDHESGMLWARIADAIERADGE